MSHIKIAIISLGMVVLVGCQPVSDHPNIIVILVDDMGLGDTSVYQDITGNTDAEQVYTPHLERLARIGVRFTDGHSPSSLCTPTRYTLLTGRYGWRSRLKSKVLHGLQADPLLEKSRPTIATLLQKNGYKTAIVGKWHLGLRYGKKDGSPAEGLHDAHLKGNLWDSPVDHGFDYARFIPRSHGSAELIPGFIHSRTLLAAKNKGAIYTGYDLGKLHSENAMDFLTSVGRKPFFLYHPLNAVHTPYTPSDYIGLRPVRGESRSVSGEPMGDREDFLYENDVALGRLLDWLQTSEDPRRPGSKLMENTFVLFVSDNGSDFNSKVSTGPFRGDKGRVYEGGHRVPFVVSWPYGGIGDGDETTHGSTSNTLVSLQDLYATFAEIIGVDVPELAAGHIGAEDSISALQALRGDEVENRPMFFHNHDGKPIVALRFDDPIVNGSEIPGKWKMLFTDQLVRMGIADPTELYNLAEDQWEEQNLINEEEMRELVEYLKGVALLHRTAGGHRFVDMVGDDRIEFSIPSEDDFEIEDSTIQMKGVRKGTTVALRFSEDVIVESVDVRAADGVCGGFYTVADREPLQIYCTDKDVYYGTQMGLLSDLGVLRAGKKLTLHSEPFLGVEREGLWTIKNITIRTLATQ